MKRVLRLGPFLFAVVSGLRCGEAPTEPRLATPIPPTPTVRPQTPTLTPTTIPPTPTAIAGTPTPTPIPPTPTRNLQTPTPTPTPGPPTDLAGRWEGTFTDAGNSVPVSVGLLEVGDDYYYGTQSASEARWDELYVEIQGDRALITLSVAGQSWVRLTGGATDALIHGSGHPVGNSNRRMTLRLTRSE